MEQTPSALEVLIKYDIETIDGPVYTSSCYPSDEVSKAMIEFATLHVGKALQAAGIIADQWKNSGELASLILSAYSLENIK